jgi:hypothetical protein
MSSYFFELRGDMRPSLIVTTCCAASASAAYVGAAQPRVAARGGVAECNFGKKVEYGDAARSALIRGVDQVANAVKVTIGPRGRNVVIRRGKENPVVINDGVSIASDVDLEAPEEQIGAKLLLQACSQTDSRAGDGTTTSAVLTQALCRVGAKYISNGANAVALQKGLVKTSAFFVEKIRSMAMPVETLEQYRDIASISANSEEMGAIVADALQRVGADGACTCEPGKELVDSLEFAEGLEHEVGYGARLPLIKHWNTGTLEHWNTGTLVHWNSGTLEAPTATARRQSVVTTLCCTPRARSERGLHQGPGDAIVRAAPRPPTPTTPPLPPTPSHPSLPSGARRTLTPHRAPPIHQVHARRAARLHHRPEAHDDAGHPPCPRGHPPGEPSSHPHPNPHPNPNPNPNPSSRPPSR